MQGMLLFFNISGGEMLLIVLVVYLVFGPGKIPEIARMMGKTINYFRRATDEIRTEITREANKMKSDIDLDVENPLEKLMKERRKNMAAQKKSATAEPSKTATQASGPDETTPEPPLNETGAVPRGKKVNAQEQETVKRNSAETVGNEAGETDTKNLQQEPSKAEKKNSEKPEEPAEKS
ncbi:MAG: hypothetical protein Kow00127_24130 [Bacteroidales bacterium]